MTCSRPTSRLLFSPLDELARRLRDSRNGHPFLIILASDVDPSYMIGLPISGCKAKLVVGHIRWWQSKLNINQTESWHIAIDKKLKLLSANLYVHLKKQYQIDIDSLVVEVSPVNTTLVLDNVGMPKVNKRRGHVRKTSTSQVDALKSNKLKKSCHGAKNRNEYQELCKTHATTF